MTFTLNKNFDRFSISWLVSWMVKTRPTRIYQILLEYFSNGISSPSWPLLFSIVRYPVGNVGKMKSISLSMSWHGKVRGTYRFIIPNGIHLGAEHYKCEYRKQQCLECQEQQEDDCRRWREKRALFPFVFDALCKLINRQEHCMRRYHCNVKLLNRRASKQRVSGNWRDIR